jgi:putative ABC transport system permease protein
MLSYYLKLGFRNLRRNPVLTALMVLTLAVGVAASMATLTVLYVMSGDPIPHKSDRLFVPQLDNGPAQSPDPTDEPPEQLTYRDAAALVAAKRGVRQSAQYGVAMAVDAGRADLPPFIAQGLAVNADFFAMFDVPFAKGGAWSATDDARGGNVVVVSRAFADRVFGAGDPLGKTVHMGNRDYAVAGVLDAWEPLPKFYRLVGGENFGDFEDFFIPIAHAINNEMDVQGSVNCNVEGEVEPGFQGLMNSECTWVQAWVELASPGDAARYRSFLDDYVGEQKKLGRFVRPLDNRLYDVNEWLEVQEVVGDDNRLQTWLAFGFLLVCLVNVVGLLLAKFTARSGEIGVRRALGAPRREVFKQYLTESAVVGLVGGTLGLALTFGVLELMSRRSETFVAIARMDWVMLSTTLVLALAASLLAGLLPTWRACQVVPAVQLKSQ